MTIRTASHFFTAQPVLSCESEGEALFQSTHFRLIAPLVLATACSPAPVADEPRVDYDARTGRLRRLEFDATGNGRNDAVSLMEGTRILRVELDADENGAVERWDFYNEDRTLHSVGFSGRNDGIMDSRAFYDDAGAPVRIEISTRRDGRFDRTEFYEGGRLVRSEEDADGNGLPDKWETYRPNPAAAPGEPAYATTSVAFDDTGTGRPGRRLFYGADGRVTRVETRSGGEDESKGRTGPPSGAPLPNRN